MTLRSLFLFIHVLSAMGVFGTLAIEGVLLSRLRRAVGTTEMRDASNGSRLLRVLPPLTLAATVVSGGYLMRGWSASWIYVAMASLFVAAGIGITTRVLRAAPSILFASFAMRMAILVGIVYLMTVKPGLAESLIAMGTATAGGLLATLASLRSDNTSDAGRSRDRGRVISVSAHPVDVGRVTRHIATSDEASG